MKTSTNRRNSSAQATTTTCGRAAPKNLLHAAESQPGEKMIGMQIGAVSFADEGVEPVLDLLQSKGAVNRSSSRPSPMDEDWRKTNSRPAFPDHGKQESDEKTFHGGNYATPHAQFYVKTVLNQTRAPEFGELDIVTTVFCCGVQTLR